MLAEDYRLARERINRLEAVKPVIRAFLEVRPRDRIGMVVFSGRAYTLAPLTFDHDWLWRRLEQMRIGAIEPGTALGDGLAMALLRLEQPARTVEGKRLGAFVVLLTDGASNCGLVSPSEAAQLAKYRGIPVYAIAVGRHGWVKVPHTDLEGKTVYRNERSDIDEVALWRIGVQTRGGFFRAYDIDKMQKAFRAIDSTRKIPFEPRRYRLTAEMFVWFTAPGLILLVAAAFGTRTQIFPEAGAAR